MPPCSSLPDLVARQLQILPTRAISTSLHVVLAKCRLTSAKLAGSRGEVMNKLNAFLFIAVTCISGCSKHFQSIGEKEDQFVPSALPEQTSARTTHELDPARTCLPRPNDGRKEWPLLAPLVSESP